MIILFIVVRVSPQKGLFYSFFYQLKDKLYALWDTVLGE